jgi:hypothetical protein
MGTRTLRIIPYTGERAYQYYIDGLKVNGKRQRLFFKDWSSADKKLSERRTRFSCRLQRPITKSPKSAQIYPRSISLTSGSGLGVLWQRLATSRSGASSPLRPSPGWDESSAGCSELIGLNMMGKRGTLVSFWAPILSGLPSDRCDSRYSQRLFRM